MPDDADPLLAKILEEALRRFDLNLEASLPRAAPHLRKYLHGVPTRPEHVFGVRNFPHFLLPWWFSPAADRAADVEFQTDLIYSSINGYYAIRLCDNIADNDGPPELRSLAPCTLYFDSEALAPYRKYFPATHAFWKSLDTFAAAQAEASAADSLFDDINAETFAAVSSRKFTGTKIPMSAVRLRYPSLESSFEQWLRFVDCLGNFAQFSNDFFDWRHDLKCGIKTYISSEARRRAPDENVTRWFLREGFDWGVAELKLRFENVILVADTLGKDAVKNWTTARGRALEDDIGRLRSGLDILKRLEKVISGQ